MSTTATVEYHTELIDGQEIQKPLPKTLHGIVQARLIVELSKWAGKLRLIVSSEQDILCGPDRLVPDIVLAGEEGPFENGYIKAEDLELAVEIMSPGQTFSDLLSKCERLSHCGTRTCWMIWPKKRKAWVYSAPEQEVSSFTFRGHKILLSVLFEGLDRYEKLGAI
ncbi:MAG: Uma2 family endonuclease [Bryobacteraceae bacterium]